METPQPILTWFITLGNLGAIVIAIFVANYLRNKILDIRQNWEGAIMPSIAFLLIHLGIYWIEPTFWTNWFNSKGFILMQVLVVAGFYTASLKTKPAGVIGKGLILVGFVGVGLGVWTTLKTTYPTYWATTSTQVAPEVALPKEYEVIAPVGEWSEKIETLHGEITYPHGPVLRRDDKWNVVEQDDVAIKKEMAPIIQTGWVQFRSRITEPVKVTVSR